MGFAKIGDDNFLGANVTITPKVLIGNDNTISAGECVFDNMNDREFFQSGIIRKKP
jgi:acetyltransferase-like isoleucine patch superfamily enzyme